MRNQNLFEKPSGRFLSKDECESLASEVRKLAVGGGRTNLRIETQWMGNIRWARNKIISSGDTRSNSINVARGVNGAIAGVSIDQVSIRAVESAMRRAERLMNLKVENPESITDGYMEPYKEPKIWFDSTYSLLAEERADLAHDLMQPAAKAGLMSAGYIQVSGSGRSIQREDIFSPYTRFTQAQFSVTVRDPEKYGSGWAGIDWNDWSRIDGKHIVEVALDKCMRSRNPVAIEPGRYMVVLEPQATHDLASGVVTETSLERNHAESSQSPSGPYNLRRGYSKIGLRVLDPRITFKFDPLDPDCSLVPFSQIGDVYNKTNWIENGVLKELSYDRKYGIENLGRNYGLPSQGSYSMSGGESSIETMISNTERGLLVTRLNVERVVSHNQLLAIGVTRDGLWLIENGKISKAVKNLRFTESPLFVLNNLLEMGKPQRVFSPKAPAVAPPIRAQDFSFTATVDAI